MDIWIRFVLAVLATWRVTHLLANEDGPAHLIARLRLRLGESIAGSLMDCFNCLSLWVAAPLALVIANEPVMWAAAWLALSGAACLLERATEKPLLIEHPLPASEGDDDVLRPTTVHHA
jgi:hypothetical protein